MTRFVLTLTSFFLFAGFLFAQVEESGKLVNADLEKAVKSDPVPADDGVHRIMKNGLYGFVINKTEVLIPFEYTQLPEKIAPVMVAQKNGATGVINDKNEVLIPFEFKTIQKGAGNTLYVVKKFMNPGWLYGAFNGEGEMVIPIAYTSLRRFGRGNEFIGRKLANNKPFTQVFDEHGQVTFEGEYESLAREGAYYIARKNRKTGLITADQTQLLPFEYQNIIWENEGVVAAKKPAAKQITLVRIADQSERPTTFTRIKRPDPFQNMIVKGVNQKEGQKKYNYGLVNADLQVILPTAFSSIEHLAGTDFYVAKKGKAITQIYDKVGIAFMPEKNILNVMEAKEGFFALHIDGLWGFFDGEGNPITAFKYQEVRRVNPKTLDVINKENIIASGIIRDNQGTRIEYIYQDGSAIPQ